MKGRSAATNPFKPTFGTSPPLLVGRRVVLEAFGLALDEGPGALGRATIYTGARGVGKTVMLNEVHDAAAQRGWLVIAETATPGLVERITNDHIPALRRQVERPGSTRRITGLSMPANLGSVSWQNDHPAVPQALRAGLDALARSLEAYETGVLLTVDELHAGDRAELREVTTTIQHTFRDERNVAFVGAGLPRAVDALLNDNVLTFLRRAERHRLGPVATEEVAVGISAPINDAGRTIDDDALQLAVAATSGYPFMIQLVGAHLWRAAAAFHIDRATAETAVAAARRQLGELVVEPTLQDLSPTDRTFLLAMAHDDGPSRLADIAYRLGVTSNYASQYRQRLINADVITRVSHGHVDYAMPATRDYLREHAAHEVQALMPDAGPGP